ncbi:ceramidase [Methylobacterium sp. J-068]|uniref:ceramidase n=1 Tax=Methylobacterium sp. J-068 TaxID=2836649 RepID=UPI001FBA7B03|nr:ceramidase [Methylobacterium sp. J-068]MCJ2037161.1 ceramidase [Methylobacterium sp. J-068]
MSDWSAPICAYCERADAGFWAEPVNALSNGAFLIAAALAARRVGQGARPDLPALALSALVAVVGLGSFLFHTLAVRWSLLADVIPIALFIYGYFLLAMRRYFGLGLVAALAATLGFSAFNLGLEPALDTLTGASTDTLTNGSIGYLPAILALAGVAAGLLRPQGCGLGPLRARAGRAVLRVAALFALSLAFRTLDRAVCPVWPLGTHALWHILNAGVLYALIRIASRYRQAVP